MGFGWECSITPAVQPAAESACVDHSDRHHLQQHHDIGSCALAEPLRKPQQLSACTQLLLVAPCSPRAHFSVTGIQARRVPQTYA